MAEKLEMLDQYVTAFRIKPELDTNKKISIIFARLKFLGHEKVCPRCGGTGHYSFNLMDGTRCYGCGGARYVPFKLTEKLLTQVKQQIQNGEMEPYYEQQRNVLMAKKASNIVLKAWQDTGISDKYKWQNACPGKTFNPEDRRIADINAKMYDEHKRIEKLVSEFQIIKDRAEQIQFATTLAREVEIAVKNIKTYALEI